MSEQKCKKTSHTRKCITCGFYWNHVNVSIQVGTSKWVGPYMADVTSNEQWVGNFNGKSHGSHLKYSTVYYLVEYWALVSNGISPSRRESASFRSVRWAWRHGGGSGSRLTMTSSHVPLAIIHLSGSNEQCDQPAFSRLNLPFHSQLFSLLSATKWYLDVPKSIRTCYVGTAPNLVYRIITGYNLFAGVL